MEYNTYNEIHQQPSVWLKTYDIILSRKKEIKDFTDKYLNEGYSVVFAGAGTSAYIGDALECALSNTRFKGCRAIATTDIITRPEIYFDSSSKVLLISFARSGNSPESVGAVRAVEQTAGKVAHVFITCNAEGSLARMQKPNVLPILLPPETNDLSLAMTSSYSSMLLACALIAEIDKVEARKPAVELLADCVQKTLDKYEKAIKEIASLGFKRAVFLGSGPLKGVAEESRLKLQELTDGGVMCAFDSFLGFRHGPKAVVHEDTLIVYLLSPDPDVQRYELDLIRGIRDKRIYSACVTVCAKAPAGLPECELLIETGLPNDIPTSYGCVSYVIVAQLLGFFKSLDSGLNPDSPSVSGNISRVVEGVTLYV